MFLVGVANKRVAIDYDAVVVVIVGCSIVILVGIFPNRFPLIHSPPAGYARRFLGCDDHWGCHVMRLAALCISWWALLVALVFL